MAAENLVVLGLGVTGDAVVRRLSAEGAAVTVLEDAPALGDAVYDERATRARAKGVELVEAPTDEQVTSLVRGADLLVVSPGVPARHHAIATAIAGGVPVRGEVDLAAERLTAPLVAVTGTNGKTTVTTLITAMLVESGVAAVAAGNIGTPLLDVVDRPADVVVAEVSSFQLVFTTSAFRPRVAVLLNVAEDHLDWHGSFEEYAAAKARVFAHQTPNDLLVFDALDEVAARLAADAPSRAWAVAAAETGDVNEAAAARAAQEMGASHEGVFRAVEKFEGLPHRRTLVGEARGVRWYDDSKATNPHATLRAVEASDAPVVLIAGGRNKGLDLGALASLAPRLRGVVAIGESAAEIVSAFADSGVEVVPASSMRDAVTAAAARARAGDAVLLSPACASFDWYRSYEERGDDFAREVTRIERVANSGLGGRP